jgi:hypothetical protein
MVYFAKTTGGPSITVTLPPPARDRLFETRNLRALPLLNRGAIKAPIAADAKPGETPLSQQAIDRSRMHAQMLGEFLNRENIVPSRGVGLGRTV